METWDETLGEVWGPMLAWDCWASMGMRCEMGPEMLCLAPTPMGLRPVQQGKKLVKFLVFFHAMMHMAALTADCGLERKCMQP